MKGPERRFEWGIEAEIEMFSVALGGHLGGQALRSIHETLGLQPLAEAPPPLDDEPPSAKKARKVDEYWIRAVGEGIP